MPKYRDESEQAGLERLKKIDAGNRNRSKRYLEKVRKAGFKQISAFLDAEAYNRLCALRDAGIQAGEPLSFGDIIGRLLVPIVNVDDNRNINIAVKDTRGGDEIPDYHGKELPQDERDAFLVMVGNRFPGKENSQKRADVLNDAGLPIKGQKGEWVRGQWTSKKTTDHIGSAKKRLKK